MPINDKYNIESFLAGVRRYLAKSNANGGRVTVEYVLLDHINDDMQHAHELAKVLKETPCKINLIPFNPSWQPVWQAEQQPHRPFLQGADGIRPDRHRAQDPR